MYLARVAAYDDAGPGVNAFLHVNANAATQAGELDATPPSRDRAQSAVGIPVLLKDNVDTADMPTTAGASPSTGRFRQTMRSSRGSCARPARSSSAKATLTEFANFIAIGMPTGYSSLGLFGFNPYDPRPLPGGDGRPVLQRAARARDRASP